MSAEALAAVYAEIPHVECRGLCARACGPLITELEEAEAAGASYSLIDLNEETWDRFRDTVDHLDGPLPLLFQQPRRRLAVFDTDRKKRCNLLHGGRCTAYDHRPGICRLWGVVESMPCHMGCIPERWLTHEEGREILNRIREAAAA